MKYKIEEIFVPGRGIELVFNLNSLSPISRHAIVFDANFKKKELIVSQTTPRVLKSFSYDTMHITTLNHDQLGDKVRLGIESNIGKFLSSYKFNKESNEEAIVINYNKSVTEVNIRSAFRIKPNKTYSMLAKLGFKTKEFYSGKHFKIFDISLSGIGLLIPNISNKTKNPLFAMEPGDNAQIGLVIKGPGNEENGPDLKKLYNKLKIVRINKKFNQKFILVGCQFSGWERTDEEELGKFIHQLQLYEIRHHQKY